MQVTQPKTITARGVWLTTTFLELLAIFIISAHTLPYVKKFAYNTPFSFNANWACVIIFGIWCIVWVIDLLFWFFCGCCVVEHYRRTVLTSNQIDMDDWAGRQTERYRREEGIALNADAA